MKYYQFDKNTLEVNHTAIDAKKRGGVYHVPRDALQIEPKKQKTGYAVIVVLDENNCAVDTDYIEDFRGSTVYNKTTQESKVINELGEIDDDYTLKVPPSKYHTFDNDDWALTDENAQKQLNDARQISTQQIDNLAADIYAQVNKFMIEYTPAEEEALAFKANNYEGEAGTYIMSDAIPNNITPKKACDNIIAKSQAWRSLLKPMRTLRMRKAELQRCTSIDEINAITDDIVSNLNAIKEQL